MLAIRSETHMDAPGIRRVQVAAFGREAEADLVDEVRAADAIALSLVAVWGGELVGHALFTPVTIGSGGAVALGPIAVLPARQGQGIGTALVRDGLSRLAAMGHPAVVVLGDPLWYTRFGFLPAGRYGVTPAEPWPTESFLALELRPRGLAGGGVCRYLAVFSAG